MVVGICGVYYTIRVTFVSPHCYDLTSISVYHFMTSSDLWKVILVFSMHGMAFESNRYTDTCFQEYAICVFVSYYIVVYFLCEQIY